MKTSAAAIVVDRGEAAAAAAVIRRLPMYFYLATQSVVALKAPVCDALRLLIIPR